MSRAGRRAGRAAPVARALAAALLLAAGGAAASPADVDRAQAAIDDIEYERARSLIDKALADGGLDTAELARAHRVAGEVAAALGDDTAARDHFMRWLLIQPDGTLAAGVSPKIAAPFEAARTEVTRLGALAVTVHVERRADKIEVRLDAHDPLAMVAGMRLRLGDASEVAVSARTATLPASDAGAIEVAVTVVDARGDVLARHTEAGTRAVKPPPTPAPAPPGRRGYPTLVRWPTWTVLAVAAAGAGGYFAWRTGKDQDDLDALNADSGSHTFDEALAIQDRGRRDALLANIGFGVAGAAAVVAVVTLVLEPDRSPERAPATVTVAPVLAPGVAGAAATIRF